jgi:hypothetical protein
VLDAGLRRVEPTRDDTEGVALRRAREGFAQRHPDPPRASEQLDRLIGVIAPRAVERAGRGR